MGGVWSSWRRIWGLMACRLAAWSLRAAVASLVPTLRGCVLRGASEVDWSEVRSDYLDACHAAGSVPDVVALRLMAQFAAEDAADVRVLVVVLVLAFLVCVVLVGGAR